MCLTSFMALAAVPRPSMTDWLPGTSREASSARKQCIKRSFCRHSRGWVVEEASAVLAGVVSAVASCGRGRKPNTSSIKKLQYTVNGMAAASSYVRVRACIYFQNATSESEAKDSVLRYGPAWQRRRPRHVSRGDELGMEDKEMNKVSPRDKHAQMHIRAYQCQ